MSNLIAPGSSADVNVRVTALTTNPNVPVTYKTVILKKNLVNGVNTLTQEMMSDENIKYVIKYDYILGEDITVPAGCILEFDGGSISGAKINNLQNIKVTSSNLGLNTNSDISEILGTGWNNIEIDFENKELKQTANLIIQNCDNLIIRNLNIKRYNHSKFCLKDCKNIIIENCVFDGSTSDQNYTKESLIAYAYSGLMLWGCTNAIVRDCTIKDFYAAGGIIIQRDCDNSRIYNNYVHNVTSLPDAGDTAGDGIYVCLSENVSIYDNQIVIDSGTQIGRCGICEENSGNTFIKGNVVMGYDRGIHIELIYNDNNIVKDNLVKRCISAFMAWGNGTHNIVCTNNYFSDEGCTAENSVTPLTYGRGVISLLTGGNPTTGPMGLIFSDNTIVADVTFIPSWVQYIYFSQGEAGIIQNNRFTQNSNIPSEWKNFQHIGGVNKTDWFVGNYVECGLCRPRFNQAGGVYKGNHFKYYEIDDTRTGFFCNTGTGVGVIFEDNNLEFLGGNDQILQVGGVLIYHTPEICRGNIISSEWRYLLNANDIRQGCVFDKNIFTRKVTGQTFYASSEASMVSDGDGAKIANLAKGSNVFIDIDGTSVEIKNDQYV